MAQLSEIQERDNSLFVSGDQKRSKWIGSGPIIKIGGPNITTSVAVDIHSMG